MFLDILAKTHNATTQKLERCSDAGVQAVQAVQHVAFSTVARCCNMDVADACIHSSPMNQQHGCLQVYISTSVRHLSVIMIMHLGYFTML